MLEGFVVKIVDSKTASVSVVDVSCHPVYGKVLRKKKKIMCQVDGLVLSVGDRVAIESSKPYSKMKKYIVVKKI